MIATGRPASRPMSASSSQYGRVTWLSSGDAVGLRRGLVLVGGGIRARVFVRGCGGDAAQSASLPELWLGAARHGDRAAAHHLLDPEGTEHREEVVHLRRRPGHLD